MKSVQAQSAVAQDQISWDTAYSSLLRLALTSQVREFVSEVEKIRRQFSNDQQQTDKLLNNILFNAIKNNFSQDIIVFLASDHRVVNVVDENGKNMALQILAGTFVFDVQNKETVSKDLSVLDKIIDLPTLDLTLRDRVFGDLRSQTIDGKGSTLLHYLVHLHQKVKSIPIEDVDINLKDQIYFIINKLLDKDPSLVNITNAKYWTPLMISALPDYFESRIFNCLYQKSLLQPSDEVGELNFMKVIVHSLKIYTTKMLLEGVKEDYYTDMWKILAKSNNFVSFLQEIIENLPKEIAKIHEKSPDELNDLPTKFGVFLSKIDIVVGDLTDSLPLQFHENIQKLKNGFSYIITFLSEEHDRAKRGQQREEGPNSSRWQQHVQQGASQTRQPS